MLIISHPNKCFSTCGCTNMVAYMDFSVTSFKRGSLNTSGLRPCLFFCQGIHCSPPGIITKPICLSRDNYETICQLINLLLSFTFQEMKHIYLFTVGQLVFLFSCPLLLFSACLFLRPCETFMNAAFYKSAGKLATSSAKSTVFCKSSANLYFVL